MYNHIQPVTTIPGTSIGEDTVRKLGHEIPEIRLRALQNIESKLQHAAALSNPSSRTLLLKFLLRWFGFKPCVQPERVVALIRRVFQEPNANETIAVLGREKILKDLNKIEKLLGTGEARTDLQHARALVQSLSPTFNPVTAADSTASITSKSSSTSTPISLSLSAAFADVHLNDDELLQTARLSYEDAWQQPAISDLQSMRLLNTALRDVDAAAAFEHAVQFMSNACNDWPGEYFLQPPYIVLNLQSLLGRTNVRAHLAEIVRQCTNVTRAVRKRLLQTQLTDTRVVASESLMQRTESRTQITVPAFVGESLRCALDHLKGLIDLPATDAAQPEINLTFAWLVALLDIAELESGHCAGRLNEQLLADVGYLLRYFREKRNGNATADGSTAFDRRMYIQLLDFMCRWISIMPAHRDTAGVCSDEMQLAVLDYPLRLHLADLCSEVQAIVESSPSYDAEQTSVLLAAGTLLRPAIVMLTTIEDNAVDDPLLATSLAAIDTLSLHRSLPLVKRIFALIQRAQPRFESNAALRQNAEQLLVRLLAHEQLDVRRLAYALCAEQMKLFFGRLLDGSAMPQRNQHQLGQSRVVFLGVPLTVDLLVEVICFGEPSDDAKIHEHANAMLLLILRSRNLLPPASWSTVLDQLMSVLPLLQAICTTPSPLADDLLNLLNPDNINTAPNFTAVACLSGNIRLLFHPLAPVRDEAMARLLYQLAAQPDAARQLPNVANITDVLPNDLCCIASQWDARQARAAAGLYDAATLDALVALLATETGRVEPAVRRSALLQIGCMVGDPRLCARFEQQRGLALTVRALRDACTADHRTDYPDAAVSAVAVLARLATYSPVCRRQLADDDGDDGGGTVLLCVLRTLLMFFANDTVRRDCAVLLFLATHSAYVTGGGGDGDGADAISVPHVLRRLHVPIVHAMHWQHSSFCMQSRLEAVLSPAAATDIQWQFVRCAFAAEHLQQSLAELPPIGTEVPYAGLQFDAALRLTDADRRLLLDTDLRGQLAQCTRRIGNATTHADVLAALASIRHITMLPSPMCDNAAKQQRLCADELTAALRRFFAVLPNTEPDFRCFEAIMLSVSGLIGPAAEALGGHTVHVWLLEQMRRKNGPLLGLLRDVRSDARMVARVCEFLQHVWSQTRRVLSAGGGGGEGVEAVRRQLAEGRVEGFGSLLEWYFETVVGLLDERFERRELDQLRSLLALLSCLTTTATSIATIPMDAEAASFIGNKLLRFVATIKSLAQTGAAFNRSCLRTVLNVMHTASAASAATATTPVVFGLRNKYVHLLSGLCGHGDIEVRTLAWSVLAECVRSFDGAVQLVRELADLPGGFHACCLSTFLDAHECSVVRSTAGAVFAELLRHIDVRQRRCLQPVYGSAPQPPTGASDSNSNESTSFSVEHCTDTIFEMLACHRFADTMATQLDAFWTADAADDTATQSTDTNNATAAAVYTSWCVVRAFCTIAVQLVRLRQRRAVRDLHAAGLVLGPVRLLPAVQLVGGQRAVRMLVEVCRFAAACVRCSADVLDGLAQGDVPAAVAAMIACLQPDWFVRCQMEAMRDEALRALLSLCVPLTVDGGLLPLVLEGDECGQRVEVLVQLVVYALRPDSQASGDGSGRGSDELIALVLQLLQNLLQGVPTVVSDGGGDDAVQMFGDLLDVVLVRTAGVELAANLCFRALHDLLKRSRASASITPDTATAIGLLLQHSSGARAVAPTTSLLSDVLDDLDAVLARPNGLTCAEFIRRNSAAIKEPIQTALRLNITILMYWFSRTSLHVAENSKLGGFTDAQLRRLCATVARLWPWTVVDARLQLTTLQMLTYASEDSLPMCQLFAQRPASTASSVLQMCADLVTSETQRPKPPSAQLHHFELAMRVVTNCCASVDGRQTLHKSHFLDAMDRLHPSVTKQQRPWPAMTREWLRFYEILTRYAESNGPNVRHLSLLCQLILKPVGSLGAQLRSQSLTIIRNMCFAAASRPALIASDQLMFVFRTVLEQHQPDSRAATGTIRATVADQLLVCTAIWRLVANCYKSKHALRAASLPARLTTLADRMSSDRPTAAATEPTSKSELLFTLEVLRLLFDK